MDPDLKSAILRSLQPSEPGSKLAGALHSSFVVTLLGGALVAILTLVAQESFESSRRREAAWETRLTDMKEVSTALADGIPRILSHGISVQRRSVWIRESKDRPDAELREARYHDRRTFEETREIYDKRRACFDETGLVTRCPDWQPSMHSVQAVHSPP